MGEDEFSAGAASVAGLATVEQVTDPAVDTTWAEGVGPVLTSPDGTEYRLSVADDGTLSTTDLSVVVSDSFTRADQTPLGTPDTGPAWAAVVGTGLSVISNTAGAGSTSDFADAVESGLADAVVTVTFTTAAAGAGSGLLLRVTDGSNYLRLNAALGRLWERVAASEALLGTMSNEDITDGDVITVTLDGTAVNVKRNGVSELTATASIVTGTKHGLRITGSTAPRYDDFEVRTL